MTSIPKMEGSKVWASEELDRRHVVRFRAVPNWIIITTWIYHDYKLIKSMPEIEQIRNKSGSAERNNQPTKSDHWIGS